MKILNFGSCNIDYVYSLDHTVRVGETETSTKMDVFPGGKGLNQSIAIARAGELVYHAGCVGIDGDMLTELLAANGVDLSYIQRVEEKNGHAIIQVTAKGENSIFIFSGSNSMVSKEFIDSVLEDFDAGDFILLQNEISNVEYIIQKAYQKQMQIVFNPSPFNEKISSVDLNMISYLMLNEVEAKEISSCDAPEESLVFFKRNYPRLKVILTLGKDGCVYTDTEHEIRQYAFGVDVVDTTAAGDTFTGYFVAQMARGTEIAKALRISTAASAIAVSRNGAAPSIPDMNEVLAIVDKLKLNDTNEKERSLLKTVEEYIDKNIKNANLEELSRLLGYSTVYMGALVKKLMGKPFSKLLQSRRCAVALEMLLNTSLSVEEIISAVGYDNESFFRKIFKEKYGKNPSEFRKRR